MLLHTPQPHTLLKTREEWTTSTDRDDTSNVQRNLLSIPPHEHNWEWYTRPRENLRLSLWTSSIYSGVLFSLQKHHMAAPMIIECLGVQSYSASFPKAQRAWLLRPIQYRFHTFTVNSVLQTHIDFTLVSSMDLNNEFLFLPITTPQNLRAIVCSYEDKAWLKIIIIATTTSEVSWQCSYLFRWVRSRQPWRTNITSWITHGLPAL